MRKSLITIILPAVALSAHLIAGCTREDAISAGGDGAVTVTGGIATKVTDESLWNADMIGVRVSSVTTTGGKTSNMASWRNAAYATASTGSLQASFSPYDGDNTIYFDGDFSADFTAYGPFVSSDGGADPSTGSPSTLPGESGLITVDTRSQHTAGNDDLYDPEQEKMDFYFASASASKSDPSLKFAFTHSMARLNLRFDPGAGITVSEEENLDYVLTGLKHDGTFNVTTGEAAVSGTAEAVAVHLTETGGFPYSVDQSDTGDDMDIVYSLVILPQQLEALTVSTTIDTGETLTAEFPLPTYVDSGTMDEVTGFEAGKSYTYDIYVRPRELDVTESGSTLTDWLDPESDHYEISPEGRDILPDEAIHIFFNTDYYSEIELGNTGAITFTDSENNTVDEIDMADLASCAASDLSGETYSTAMDVIPSGEHYRVMWRSPVELNDGVLTIRPHSFVLDYGSSYTVTISSGVLSANGAPFSGSWTFDTREAPSDPTDITVGTHCETIQYALSYASAHVTDGSSVKITVPAGTYNEPLFLYDMSNVTITCPGTDNDLDEDADEDAGKAVVQWDACQNTSSGEGASMTSRPTSGSTVTSGGHAAAFFEDCDGLRLENITFRNSYSGTRVQAAAIDFNGTGKLEAVNCGFKSRQATMLTSGYNWFYNCVVEGTVFYIWGTSPICLFENSEIRTVYDATVGSWKCICQARCASASDVGYVFLGCDLTYGDNSSSDPYPTFLANAGGSYDNVTYVNCKVKTDRIKGWYANTAPNPSTATASSGWRYYSLLDCTSDEDSTTPVDFSAWVYDITDGYTGSADTFYDFTPYIYELSAAEYASGFSSRDQIFSSISWSPAVE